MNFEEKPKDNAGGDDEKGDKSTRISWHPAFIEAIQLELEDYQDSLEFYPEYQLSSEPLRIDCVIIKKAKAVQIRKNIAAIFREVNLIEYKSPDDYVSVDDFYKAYAYTCLYVSFEKIPITSLTISFVGSRNPKVLLSHLRDIRAYKVEETSNGIYTVSGDILPIQIIDSSRLSADENLWLRDLCYKLDAGELKCLLEKVSRQSKAARIGAYLDAITRANTNKLQEAYNMSNSQLTVEEVLEEIGLTAKWEARGKESEAIAIAKKMVCSGFPLETVVSITELDPEKVKALYTEVSL